MADTGKGEAGSLNGLDELVTTTNKKSTATAMQAGMLFHTLSRPGSGIDIEQITMHLHGELDLERFDRAWRVVCENNDILRSRFTFEGSQTPRRTISPVSEVPTTHCDWSALDPAGVENALADLTARDRRTDFVITEAPLHRLVIAKIAEDHWWVLWTFHHALLDGRSFSLVLDELFTIYDNDLATSPVQRPNFQDYVDGCAAIDDNDASGFWASYLEGASLPTVIDMPGPVAAPDAAGSETPTGFVAERLLSEASTAELNRLAETSQATLNTVAQSAWATLLHHYSQQLDVTFGVTRACRHAEGAGPDMVGLLINTVPMRVQLDPAVTVAELLTATRNQQLDLRSVETTPLPVINRAAGVKATFDTALVFDDATLDARMQEMAQPATGSRRFSYSGQTNFPVTALLYGGPELLVRIETSPDHYDPEFGERLLDQFVTLLEGFAEAPHQPAIEVPYLSARDAALLESWNTTATPYDLSTSLHSHFEAQVERTPDAVALTMGGTSLSYDEFNQRANRLAHHLREQGVGRNDLVGVFTDRSTDMLVALYAVVKAGGAYVPFDPEHPADRLRFVVEDSEVSMVLTQEHLADSLPHTSADVVLVDVENPAWADAPSTNPRSVNEPDDLAYMIYTSGSTGKPKGTMNTHRGIVNRLLWMQEAYGLDHTDVVVQKTPFTFDVSVWELFWPQMVGARLVIAEPGGHRDPHYLATLFERAGVTTAHFVPSMLALFLEEPRLNGCDTLRRVICSGEALPRALQDRFFERLSCELHNLYGPTEAAIDVSWWTCDPDSPLPFVPIGAAIANTQLHVLDAAMRPVAPGIAGELHIGGAQVARGYHRREELTAERFVPDPFSDDPSHRLYKTGDRARFLSDGNIEFLGRLDFQVKIRGFRIELGEIESVLTNHHGVREAVVVAREDQPGDHRLVAYVVGDADEGDLRSHAAAALPAYMVPAVWVSLPEMPLNANGKTDRGALPAPPSRAAVATLTPPTSITERKIASIWEDVLGAASVGTSEAFFDCGGSSLALIRLGHQMSEHFGFEITVPQLIRHPTVGSQAEFVDAALTSSPTTHDPAGSNGAKVPDHATLVGSQRASEQRAARSRRRARRG
jgi:amino acid adenylation domain-containing protein